MIHALLETSYAPHEKAGKDWQPHLQGRHSPLEAKNDQEAKEATNNGVPIQEHFIRKDVKYDLRIRSLLQIPAAKSITFGIDYMEFRGSLLWNSIPDLIKRASSAAIFQRSIRNCSGEECHCKICMTR